MNVSLSFSVENELSRMVVSVILGLDWVQMVLRRFPPEEFLSVAKFITKNSRRVERRFSQGILFDQYS